MGGTSDPVDKLVDVDATTVSMQKKLDEEVFFYFPL